MAVLRALMLGDVVGESGLVILEQRLPGLIAEREAAFVVVNGENAADGFGMTGAVLTRMFAAGADIVSSGNHIWEKRDFWPVMDREERLLRPANYPQGAAGRGWVLREKAGAVWLTINLQGREYLSPIDCPFKTFDVIAAQHGLPAPGEMSARPPGRPITLVDFHAESPEEKEALAFYLDGRASLVAGTHTHIQTADERVLPRGTGYITDLGMTGPGSSIIGMDTKICLDRARTQIAYRMECAKTPAILQGVLAELDSETGLALALTRISAA